MEKTLLLNRYELLEKIGEGGMGVVYKAKCTLLDRLVAVKILKPGLGSSEDLIKRFKNEANSIAKLSHPNIVNIYDAGSENNINFIVMEYINGKTLKQIIKNNVKLSFSEAIDITLQIAKALEYAHKNNIIHRDIKPDNILITDDNTAKLTDFGIAKVSDSLTITYPNKIIGSVHYFSPEQAKGRLVDYRTDIYSLGIIMYEMLTGKVPYNAELPISIAMMHIQEPVTPPKEINHNIPENINLIILKALEKDPINRFQTANELIHILNLIKEDSNLKVNFKNKSDTSTLVVDSTVLSSNSKINNTVKMAQIKDSQTLVIKKDTKKNKKIFLSACLLVLVVLVGALWKTLSKEPAIDINTADSESTINETSNDEALQENLESEEPENIAVPSLVGNTQADAQSLILSNGFSLGNITNEYSATVPKGLIIRQWPLQDTLYEKNNAIDLFISLGPEITQVIEQTVPPENATETTDEKNTNNNDNEKSNNNNKNKNNNNNGNNNKNKNKNNNNNGNKNNKGEGN